MKQSKNQFDIVVVGGGHAGIEASHIAAFKGSRIALVTMDPGALGRMSCNPAIGGLAKGQMVREIDALGGLMGRFADSAGLQYKMLNRSKGRSVWSPRAQIDKRNYEALVRRTIISIENITIITGEVVELLERSSRLSGVVLRDGTIILCGAVVLTCGTFLSGIVHVGGRKIPAGRMGEPRSIGITEYLLKMGFKTGRLKTGTPPRALCSSIDWTKTRPVYGDIDPSPFSFQSGSFNPPNEPCYTVRTNASVHDIIIENIDRSPMYSGDIFGTGPRYCPSIEDKVKRFYDQPSHLLFLEPEWKNSDQIYINGFSTSLPEEIQINSLKKIPAFKNVELLRPGYAIEYDFFPPSQLKSTLETKDMDGLFFAGQVNGTSGYEEAAAQGLIAGINAHCYNEDTKPLILKRKDAYIGVLIDDLVTKDTLEPYRMFTSRAEYRILLRYSNADDRLFSFSKTWSLLSNVDISTIEDRIKMRGQIRDSLSKSISLSDIKNIHIDNNQRGPANTFLKRPEIKIFDLPDDLFSFSLPSSIPSWSINEVFLDVEAEIKYSGYIKRHRDEIEKQKKNESLKIWNNFEYSNLPGLSLEAREKLTSVRPETLGQAMRVSGITPADISVLMVHIFR